MSIRIVTHNIDEPRNPKDAAEALWDATQGARFKPAAYLLQECKGAKRAFVERFGDEYRVLMSDAANASLITMVHKNAILVNERYVHMTQPWIGPKLGIRQEPRVHNLTDILMDGEAVRLYNVHRVWMPKSQERGLTSVAAFNRTAWIEEHRRIKRVAEKRGSRKRAFFCAGDQNQIPTDHGVYSVTALATEVGAKRLLTGAAVDWGFIVGGDGEGVVREKIGSDHPWANYLIWEK